MKEFKLCVKEFPYSLKVLLHGVRKLLGTVEHLVPRNRLKSVILIRRVSYNSYYSHPNTIILSQFYWLQLYERKTYYKLF